MYFNSLSTSNQQSTTSNWVTSISTSVNDSNRANDANQSSVQRKPIIIYADSSLVDLMRIRLAFALKAVDYLACRIDLNSNEHRSDDYRRVNPTGHLPALLVMDNNHWKAFPITSIQAILEYVEEVSQQHPHLMPNSTIDRARIRTLMFQMLRSVESEDIQMLEHLLLIYGCGRQFKYSMGDEVSLLDCCLLPLLLPPPLQQHNHFSNLPENLSRIARNLIELEAIKLTLTTEIEPNVSFAALRELL